MESANLDTFLKEFIEMTFDLEVKSMYTFKEITIFDGVGGVCYLVISVDVRPVIYRYYSLIIPTTNTTQNFTIA